MEDEEQQFAITKKEIDRINNVIEEMQKKIVKREKEDKFIRWGIFILMLFSIAGISGLENYLTP